MGGVLVGWVLAGGVLVGGVLVGGGSGLPTPISKSSEL